MKKDYTVLFYAHTTTDGKYIRFDYITRDGKPKVKDVFNQNTSFSWFKESVIVTAVVRCKTVDSIKLQKRLNLTRAQVQQPNVDISKDNLTVNAATALVWYLNNFFTEDDDAVLKKLRYGPNFIKGFTKSKFEDKAPNKPYANAIDEISATVKEIDKMDEDAAKTDTEGLDGLNNIVKMLLDGDKLVKIFDEYQALMRDIPEDYKGMVKSAVITTLQKMH